MIKAIVKGLDGVVYIMDLPAWNTTFDVIRVNLGANLDCTLKLVKVDDKKKRAYFEELKKGALCQVS